jgi:hypothetical protein
MGRFGHARCYLASVSSAVSEKYDFKLKMSQDKQLYIKTVADTVISLAPIPRTGRIIFLTSAT